MNFRIAMPVLILAMIFLMGPGLFAESAIQNAPVGQLPVEPHPTGSQALKNTDTVQILSLKELIDEAMQRNPGLKAANQRVKAADSRIPQERWSLPDPMVGVDIEGRPRNPANFTDYMDIEYMVEQEIPNPLKLWMRGRVAGKERDMTQASYSSRERKLIADIKSAYYDLFMIERSIEVNRQTKDLLTQFHKSAESRYTTGKAGQPDVLKAQVEITKLMNELVTLDQQKQTAAARLNVLLNRPTRMSLGTTLRSEKSQARSLNWEELEKKTLENSPDLKGMDSAIQRQESALRLAEFEYLPDFKLRSENRQIKNEGLQEYDAFLGVTIPLWGFGKQRNQVKEAKAILEEAKANYQEMKNAVLFELQDALVRVESNHRLKALYETSVLPQAQQSLKSAVAGYESDRNDFLTLIDAQRNLKTFHLEYYDAVAKLEQSFADLERTVGTDLEVL